MCRSETPAARRKSGDERRDSDDTNVCPGPHRRSVVRRAVLATVATAAVGALAGCTGDEAPESTPEPVAVSAGMQCDVCGMVIADHPGPNGELFYANQQPGDHENPARFDSLRGCLFPYYFEHETLGWEAVALYVTDYSTVDYTLSTADGETYISSHTAPGSFTEGRKALYVVGSGIQGAMGPDFISFSSRGDADAFATDNGGDVLGFDEITPETLQR